jgi:plasmid stabilization system protein ParE
VSVVVSPEAVGDLEAAVDFLAERNPKAAARLVDRAFDLFRQLEANEFEGPEQVLSDGSMVRSWPMHPFRVYYQRRGSELVVLRVYHQARRPL